MYIRKILIGILITGIVIGFFIMYNITQTIFKPITAFSNEEAYVYIPSDADFKYVQQELESLLTDTEAFTTLATKIGYAKQVKGGKYTITKGMNSNDIIKILMNRSDIVMVTIPDSNELELLSQQISNQIEASEEDLFKILQDTLFLKEKNLMFPTLYKFGTYKMQWNTSAEAFRSYMYKAHQNELSVNN